MRRLTLALVLGLAAASVAAAAIAFPPLTGRVVDQANILSPQTEAQLTAKLAALEAANGRQLVVATVSSLQDQSIEDYGYQLGRAWGIGRKDANDGAILLVAPNDRKVRVEVGYGLEGVLTDALSSTILQSAVLPRFKAGDMEGGVVAGTDALVEQLSLNDGEAQARAAQAAAEPEEESGPGVFTILIIGLALLMFLGGGRRRRGGILPWIILGGLSGGGGRGGGGRGGGGFGGGGGSFGGGGSSGSW